MGILYNLKEVIKTINKRIKCLRENKGYNMRQMASALNLPYTTYVNYEKGTREPNSEQLLLIAKYFGTTTDYLIGLTDIAFPSNNNIFGKTDIVISESEKNIIIAYRNTTDDMRNAVNKLLGLDTELHIGRLAAYGGGTTEKSIPDVTAKDLEDEEEAAEIKKKLRK